MSYYTRYKIWSNIKKVLKGLFSFIGFSVAFIFGLYLIATCESLGGPFLILACLIVLLMA